MAAVTSQHRVLEVALRAADAAAEALATVIGSPVAAAGVRVDASDQPALEDAIAARTHLNDGPAPGSLITVVSGGGVVLEDGSIIDAVTLIDTLVAGAALAFGEAIGTVLRPMPSELLTGDADDAANVVHAIRYEIATGFGKPIPVHWLVEASLAALLFDGGPVAPSQSMAPSVAPARLSDLGEGSTPVVARKIATLSDVKTSVTVEMGRAVLRVRDLMSLAEGSLVELDREPGAEVDVFVNGALVARGDVAVIDDELGVRIATIVEYPASRGS